MDVSRYLFQSPSPQQVQIGKPDPSVQKEETTAETETQQQETVQVPQDVQDVRADSAPQQVRANPEHLLDIYV